jgi:glutathione peroxidase
MYIFILLLVGFCIYVVVVTRHAKQLTVKQRIIKATYPFYAGIFKKLSKEKIMITNSSDLPPVSFYSLKDILNNGKALHFEQLKDKKVLLVNTASDCGYTAQYEGLEKLSRVYKDKLVVIGFPSNDFGEQERADDETIASFCQVNYGVSFSLVKKSIVNKTRGQNKVFEWLSESGKNGWNDKAPSWNFCKYLVDETGRLTHFFPASVEPMDKEIITAIE